MIYDVIRNKLLGRARYLMRFVINALLLRGLGVSQCSFRVRWILGCTWLYHRVPHLNNIFQRTSIFGVWSLTPRSKSLISMQLYQISQQHLRICPRKFWKWMDTNEGRWGKRKMRLVMNVRWRINRCPIHTPTRTLFEFTLSRSKLASSHLQHQLTAPNTTPWKKRY